MTQVSPEPKVSVAATVAAVSGSSSPNGTTAERPRLITRPALAAAGRPRVTVVVWLLLLATGIYAFEKLREWAEHRLAGVTVT